MTLLGLSGVKGREYSFKMKLYGTLKCTRERIYGFENIFFKIGFLIRNQIETLDIFGYNCVYPYTTEFVEIVV